MARSVSLEKALGFISSTAQQGYDALGLEVEKILTVHGRIDRGPRAKGNGKGRGEGKGKEGGGGALPMTYATALPKPGTLTADLFLTACRDAGKREAKNPDGTVQTYEKTGLPVVVVDPVARRLDEMYAVAGFLGWDAGGGGKLAPIHGVQLEGARRKAAFLMKGGAASLKPYSRTVAWTLKGYVKGMPDAEGAILADLLARQELAAKMMGFHQEQMDEQDRIVDDETAPAQVREAAAEEADRCEARMMLEAERIQSIRKLLAEKGFQAPPSGETLTAPLGEVASFDAAATVVDTVAADAARADLQAQIEAAKAEQAAILAG